MISLSVNHAWTNINSSNNSSLNSSIDFMTVFHFNLSKIYLVSIQFVFSSRIRAYEQQVIKIRKMWLPQWFLNAPSTIDTPYNMAWELRLQYHIYLSRLHCLLCTQSEHLEIRFKPVRCTVCRKYVHCNLMLISVAHDRVNNLWNLAYCRSN